ncbi:RING-H2 finger protein ATL3 [Lathyrus oleraceus]|uniref:RING-H2 finger protein ATL3 n=1 Tax=Pisum sativum TaxID=3888 RepID=UPI0021D24E12|nr:RING-H2 finger protein ATL3-like [Pisum sativum]
MSDLSATGDNLSQSTAVDITGKVMVVIIVILFMFVVIFLFFHLFAKGFWWSHNSQADNNSQSRRRRRHGQQGAVLGEGGLDPLILNSLPVSVFNSEKDGLDLECSVCLSELVEGEKVRVLPKCNHRFHIDCIDMWFQSHSTCPLCRTTLAASPSSSLVVEIQPSSAAAFPTNVLIWGNHDQTISSTSEQNNCSSSSSSSEGTSEDGMLRIDIPNHNEATSSSSSSSSPTGGGGGGRLRSLKRLLSNSRLNPWSPTAAAATTSLPKESAAGHS